MSATGQLAESVKPTFPVGSVIRYSLFHPEAQPWLGPVIQVQILALHFLAGTLRVSLLCTLVFFSVNENNTYLKGFLYKMDFIQKLSRNSE